MNTAAAPEWLPSVLVPFFTLSYPTPRPASPDSYLDSEYFNIGRLDGCFIVTCIAVMAIARDVSRIFFLEPFARWKLSRDVRRRHKILASNGNGHHVNGNGIANGKGLANGNGKVANGKPIKYQITQKEKKVIQHSVTRFAEQGWAFIYYILQWSYGLYVYRNSPATVFNTDPLWQGYPHIPLAGPVKFYYLTQTAFYMHSVLVLNAEAPRKDHLQMMTHHVITIALMVCSYFYNFTRVGCMIMVLMDWCDIFLPLAKMIRYLGWQTLCDITFGVFVVSWAATRHLFFGLIIWSTYNMPERHIPYGWVPEKGYFFTDTVYAVFLGMLISLQIIQIIWFVMVIRVVYRVLSGQGADDSRSDGELEEEEDNIEEVEGKKHR